MTEESTETCKYWRFGFCSRGEKCKFQHPQEEFGIERDPNLPVDVTKGEQKAGGKVSGDKKRGRDSEVYTEPPRKKGKGGGSTVPGAITIEISGIPSDASMREVTQIFRQYDGFLGCKLFPSGVTKMCTVDFADRVSASYMQEMLQGYQFDERNDHSYLDLRLGGVKGKGKTSKGSKGKGKGKARAGK